MHRVVLSGNGEIAVRLGAALILGSALGLNRELHGKPAAKEAIADADTHCDEENGDGSKQCTAEIVICRRQVENHFEQRTQGCVDD